MTEERGNVLIVTGAFSVLLLWTVLPDVGMVQPFPFNPIVLDFSTYIWIATIYAAFLMFTWAMYRAAEKTKEFFNVVFILQALQFIEYFLNYNATWFQIGFYPVTIATIRFPVLLIFSFKTFIQWNR